MPLPLLVPLLVLLAVFVAFDLLLVVVLLVPAPPTENAAPPRTENTPEVTAAVPPAYRVPNSDAAVAGRTIADLIRAQNEPVVEESCSSAFLDLVRHTPSGPPVLGLKDRDAFMEACLRG